jgi:hypothetical protein
MEAKYLSSCTFNALRFALLCQLILHKQGFRLVVDLRVVVRTFESSSKMLDCPSTVGYLDDPSCHSSHCLCTESLTDFVSTCAPTVLRLALLVIAIARSLCMPAPLQLRGKTPLNMISCCNSGGSKKILSNLLRIGRSC